MSYDSDDENGDVEENNGREMQNNAACNWSSDVTLISGSWTW